MKKKLMVSMAAAAFFAGVISAPQIGALSIGSIVKVGGIGILVDRYGSEIDSFLNKLLKQNNLSTVYATKVVPIVSIGTSGYIGAAQVTGPTEEVERVQAVAQLEASFNNIARIKGLIPIDSTNPSGASRIQGVGVSAIIDLKI